MPVDNLHKCTNRNFQFQCFHRNNQSTGIAPWNKNKAKIALRRFYKDSAQSGVKWQNRGNFGLSEIKSKTATLRYMPTASIKHKFIISFALISRPFISTLVGEKANANSLIFVLQIAYPATKKWVKNLINI